jgi:DNA-binding transcriptional MerR regulator
MSKPITSQQAAAILGVTPRTVRRYVESGDLRSFGKLPGRTGALLFREVDVQRLAVERGAAHELPDAGASSRAAG